MLLWLMSATAVYGQGTKTRIQTAELVPVASISRNSVANLHAERSELWVGPSLNVTRDDGATWFQADVDSIRNGRGRVFSLDVEGDRIWVGLGFSKRVSADGQTDFVRTAGGFAFSHDGGTNWSYRPPPLDIPGDTVITYGLSTIPALDIIVPEQSPPFDIDFDPESETVWTAGWASGLRRSVDDGQTWQRVVLPPDTLSELVPDREYDFLYDPRSSEGAQNLNFSAFSVLVDETGTVWAGTAGGLNRSTDGGVSWRRFSATDLASPLLGNWIISIEEQPNEGRNPVWFATWRAEGASEHFGAMVTRDGGETFESFLTGERIYDFAFGNETIYAAGEKGLFVSRDNGQTWVSISHFRDAERPDRLIRQGARVFSVALTPAALWVGTEDGLARSVDDGASWTIIRSEVPLHPPVETDDIPDTDTYAYPNPFTPAVDGVVRVRYELASEQHVTVRVFDFAMNLVQTVTDQRRPAGIREDQWNGIDERGLRVPSGPYLYAVTTDDGTFWGKILVVQ